MLLHSLLGVHFNEVIEKGRAAWLPAARSNARRHQKPCTSRRNAGNCRIEPDPTPHPPFYEDARHQNGIGATKHA
jgi:hypothetical protein